MDQIVIPNFRKRVLEAFAAAEKLGITSRKQANLFGKTLKLAENLPALKEKIASELNEEVAERAGHIIAIAERVDALCKNKTDLKRFMHKRLHHFGERTPIDILTSSSMSDLSEFVGSLESPRI